jgi:hypothetical protein
MNGTRRTTAKPATKKTTGKTAIIVSAAAKRAAAADAVATKSDRRRRCAKASALFAAQIAAFRASPESPEALAAAHKFQKLLDAMTPDEADFARLVNQSMEYFLP